MKNKISTYTKWLCYVSAKANNTSQLHKPAERQPRNR